MHMYVISALWRLSWEYPKFKARLASEEEPLPKQNRTHVLNSPERLSTSGSTDGNWQQTVKADIIIWD